MTRKKSAMVALSFCLLVLCGSAAEAAEPETDSLDRKTVTISGSVGLPGVTLVGLPSQPVSDARGLYAVQVPSGWSGTVEPRKAGHEFAPPSRTYERIASDCANQDYVPRVLAFTISGNAGLGGVTMEGLPGGPIADTDGFYSAMVEYGWSGVVRPKRGDRKFNPADRRYTMVSKDLTDEDYIPQTVVICDRIVAGTEPIAQVVVTAEPGGYTATTDAQGYYRIEVPYGWTGMLSMSKPGFEFTPPSIPFTRVTSDIDKTVPSGGDLFEPFPPRLDDMRPRRSAIPPVDGVLVIPTTSVAPDEFAETSEDIRVMQQILRDLLTEPRMILGVLQDYGDFLGGEGRRHEAFYLQGFGVLFVMEVDFPLSPVAAPGVESEPPSSAPVDPVWQRARQRLYAPPGGAYRSRTQPNQRQQMNFEQFKADLIDTLRHAANIRHVDPNEQVVLTVVGQAPDAGAPSRGGFSAGAGGYFEGGSYSYSGGSFGAGGGSSYADSRSYVRGTGSAQAVRRRPSAFGTPATTVLTIQAKKADVDAFAAGRIDAEQFRQRTKVFTY